MVFLLHLCPEMPREAFALWQMMAEDFQPTLGLLPDGQEGGRAAGSGGPGSPLGCGSSASPPPGQARASPGREQGTHPLQSMAPEVWGTWGFAPAKGLKYSLLPSPQKIPDLLQPCPRGHLAGGHLQPARSEDHILQELPQGPGRFWRPKACLPCPAPQVLGQSPRCRDSAGQARCLPATGCPVPAAPPSPVLPVLELPSGVTVAHVGLCP